MRSALTLYFASLLKSYLLSPAMYAGLAFFAGFFSLIGAYFSKFPLPGWFSMTYLMFTFAIAGGLSRSIVVGSAAFNYLIRHAGISPIKLILVLVATGMISQIIFSSLFLIITILIYYTANKTVPMVDIGLVISAIILSSLFMATFGVALGLIMVGRTATAKIANFIPMLPMIIYFVSLLTPADISSYNPITAIMMLLAYSLGGEKYIYIVPMPSTLSLPILVTVILTSSIILLILSILLVKRIREVNIYDVAMSF
ncbi:hypothetical protein Igag_0219 [Ignisphaera aggregans DSM 17230]|uniref:Uncharacterized protein n=1 Tax=Ignisphaera aggregans (strain DSM 17230 / JCM 13409 / AQ1.S1) TaxID=583356 RepID=E0SQB8_IGNAA|nr:hypothetical protein Igag_0219 [Ignisphaera aggregans DSM 17230]